jgi:hypothetical protein
MTNVTTLGEAQITASPHDVVTIELGERDGSPAIIKITWPLHPTVVDPRRFPDLAAAIAQLFARAHIVLAAIRADRRL